MRKIIGLFALVLLLAGIPMLAGAANPPSGGSSSGTSASGGGNRAPIINGRRASGRHGAHFRHKNRSNEPADDNKAPVPDVSRKHDGHDGKDGKGGKDNKDSGKTGTP